jgi:hypothetical protein
MTGPCVSYSLIHPPPRHPSTRSSGGAFFRSELPLQRVRLHMANIVLPSSGRYIDRPRRKDVDHATRPTNAASEDRGREGG